MNHLFEFKDLETAEQPKEEIDKERQEVIDRIAQKERDQWLWDNHSQEAVE